MKYILTFILFSFFAFAEAQVEKTSKLYLTLAKNDSLLFTEGLNKCNPKLMAKFINKDFEFYHDKGGIDKGKEGFIKGIEKMCANKEFENRRVLVKGSLEVFPLYDNGKLYGAIQKGKHKFGDSTPLFTRLWLLQDNGTWQITRVLSYDH